MILNKYFPSLSNRHHIYLIQKLGSLFSFLISLCSSFLSLIFFQFNIVSYDLRKCKDILYLIWIVGPFEPELIGMFVSPSNCNWFLIIFNLIANYTVDFILGTIFVFYLVDDRNLSVWDICKEKIARVINEEFLIVSLKSIFMSSWSILKLSQMTFEGKFLQKTQFTSHQSEEIVRKTCRIHRIKKNYLRAKSKPKSGVVNFPKILKNRVSVNSPENIQKIQKFD